jgi:lipopolysaccharide biosynthesis glycosyltransferase
MSEIYHIAVACDNSFVNHTIVTLHSLKKFNSNRTFFVHILDSGISGKFRLKFKLFLFRFGFKFQFYKIDYSQIKNAPVSHHVNLASYNRLFLSNILNEKIERVLYLDSDIIVLGQIDTLLDCDIKDFFVGAAAEIITNSDRNRLELNSFDQYFNAGVLVVNLKKWREENIFSKFVDFISKNSYKIKYWDQDVLNYCLKNKWLRLPQKYNLTHFYFYPNDYTPSYFGLNQTQYEEIQKDPVIIHYTSHQKPWIEGCKHPKKELYFQYQLTFKQLLFDKIIISTKN